MSATTDDRVTSMRSFNRFYTRRIGLLGAGYLGTDHTLPQARVLFELGRRDVTEVSELRRTLDIDPGYLSRLLARLEDDRLVSRDRSPADARRQVVRLTKAGARAHALLDARSSREIRGLLEALHEGDQRRAIGAMRVIEDVLGDERAARTFELREPRPGDYGWIVQRHGELYAQEYAWDGGFETLVARIVADYVEGRDPEREAAWIAEADGERLGCVLCVRQDDRVAKLRLLLVEPSARGMGVGSALVDECLAFARRARYAEMTLWTNHPLTAARRIYERAGFELVAEEPHRRFGPELVGQTWTRSLS